jgi:ATP-binding cassette subfamily C protein CydC
MASQRRFIRLGMLCAVLAALSAVGLLAVSGWFLVGAALAGLAGPLAVQGFNYLLPSAGIRAAAILRTGTRYGERMLGHRAALFALAQVRTTLFARVAARALAGHDAGRSGMLANQLGKEVDALEDGVIRQVSRPGAWTGALAGLVAAMALGWRCGVILLIALILMRLAGRVMAARLLPDPLNRAATAHAALQADYADMAGPGADIAIYGLGPAMAAALTPPALDYDRARQDLARAEGMIAGAQTWIAVIATALIALTGQGVAPLFALGLLGAMAGLEAWGTLVQTDMRGHDLMRAQRHLAELSGETQPINPPALPENPPLTLCGRTFQPGSRVLLRGASGAGKTRLIETLVGLRQDAPQELAVAGYDPRALGLAALRPIFALAAQDAPLIAGSLADNLLLARPGLDEGALWDALGTACVEDVVRALPDGLHQWLGDDGARLSGGQRRRIVLARALLAGRPWLVLDEPSEGLDAQTEARLMTALAGWLDHHGTGLLLISHRPAMATLADRVVDL